MKRATALLSAMVFIFCLVIVGVAKPITAHASAVFSHGAGTEENPYLVANCDQLQALQNNLAAFYKLVSNIDCDANDFGHIGSTGSPFTGSLDGNYKIVKNLHIDDFGLFGAITGGTVKNLKLDSPSVSGSTNVGSLAGTVREEGTTITNVHVRNGSVSGSSNYIGGMVGTITLNNPVLEKSSFTGTVSSPGVMGGFIGDAGSAAYIHNNYVMATLTIGPDDAPSVGGFVGLAGSSQMADNYAVTSINATNAGFLSTVGGFGGVGTGWISTSFADMALTGTPNQQGDFLGYAAGLTVNANYYADHGHWWASNTNAGGGVSAVDTNANPTYFYTQTSHAPLTFWDFENTWREVDGDYPVLRGEAGFSEASTDINGDSINDTYQANVIGVPDAEDNLTTVELDSDSGCTLDPAGSWIDSGYYKADPNFSLQIPKMTAFTVYCPTNGAQVSVALVYPDRYDTSKSVLRFYNDVTNEYHNVSGVVFGTRVVNGKTVTTATYTLVDGGVNDTDSTTNGVIEDPVGIATDNTPSATPSANNASSSDGGGTLAKTGQETQRLVLMGIFTASSSLAFVLSRGKYVYRLRSK